MDRKKISLIAIVTVIVVGLISAMVYAGTRYNPDADTSSDETEKEKWQEGVIEYDGKYYKYNNNIKSYLFLGIDKEGDLVENDRYGDGGQTDAMFLLVQDKSKNELSIIGINRNTMVELIADDKGGDTVIAEGQICVQFAVGDGGRISGDLTTKTVSKLFDDIPISGYYAMNMEGIKILNNGVGGVEVEVLEDIDGMGVSLEEGDTVKLDDDEAYAYIRWRRHDQTGADDRLARQQQYLEALAGVIKTQMSEDASGATDLYESLEDYSVTNIQLGDLILELQEYEYSGEMLSIPGETVEGEEASEELGGGHFAEFHPDEKAFKELILEIFYDEVEEP